MTLSRPSASPHHTGNIMCKTKDGTAKPKPTPKGKGKGKGDGKGKGK